ncbi:MAG: hypothetical protein QMD32_09010, partial [Smithellaceae bacterium]|nr:hypothetical protein [Smithellaceae bacterium]
PNLLAMLTILFLGIVAARIIRLLLRKLLLAMKFDSWSDRKGFTVMMRRGDIWSNPSEALSRVVFWVIILFTVMIALGTLNVQALDNLVAQFFLYLPRVLSAIVILIIGYLATGFLSRALIITLVNSGYHYAKLLVAAVRLLLIMLILAMAMEQLQVAPNIVLAAFSIIFGGLVVALAIAFGVGGIDAARRIIAKGTAEKKEEDRDIEHL